MHISFKIIKFYFTLCCSTCFGHHCVQIRSFLLLHMQSLVTVWCWVGCFLQPCSVVTAAFACAKGAVTTDQGWRKQPTQHHTVTRACMCSNKKLLMMDTMVSETCRAAQSEIKFYDFKTNVHLVGFYSVLLLKTLVEQDTHILRTSTTFIITNTPMQPFSKVGAKRISFVFDIFSFSAC
jgi:hypothetical protein